MPTETTPAPFPNTGAPASQPAVGGHDGGGWPIHIRHDGGYTPGGGGGLCRTQGWYWVPGGLAVDRPAPIFQGAALPGALGRSDPAEMPLVLGTSFPDGGWDPLLRAATIAMALWEWLDRQGLQTLLDEKHAEAMEPDSIRAELLTLFKHALSSRKTFDAEVRAQAGDFSTYFGDLLGASPACRPNTWSLVLIGLQLGGLVTSHFKMHYRRARPAQVWPAIQPMIDTPPHPAFPSGHAMQAYLIAALAGMVVPPGVKQACDSLAKTVHENREVAGVHWPSDGAASFAVVDRIAGPLRAMMDDPGQEAAPGPATPGLDAFRRVAAAARDEWRLDAEYGGPDLSPPDVKALRAKYVTSDTPAPDKA